MSETLAADICVIGAGVAGLSVAAGAAQLGARTVLIERDRMGGQRLNSGCVPSKAMLATAGAVHAARLAGAFGGAADAIAVDWDRVRGHLRSVIADLAPNDSEARFEGLGVRVLKAAARFLSPDALVAGDSRVQARRFVVATGSVPAVPPIDGLSDVPYLTSDTAFDNAVRPAHLVIVGGGGSASVELAQAHARLGCRVTLLEPGAMLADEDPELVDVVRRRLQGEGVVIHEWVEVRRVEGIGSGVAAVTDIGGLLHQIVGSHLLVVAGRRPATDGLGLSEAGIVSTAHGITVDDRLRTSNPRVFALGDVAGAPRLAHAATDQAGVVLRNALLRWPSRAGSAVPRVAYTAPGLASVGMSAAQASESGRRLRILRWPFAEVDRARTDGDIDGMIKVVVTPRGRVLGAAIVGPSASELILPWTLAVDGKLSLRDLATAVVPYPTLNEISRRVAGSFYAPRIFSPAMKRLVRAMAWFG